MALVASFAPCLTCYHVPRRPETFVKSPQICYTDRTVRPGVVAANPGNSKGAILCQLYF